MQKLFFLLLFVCLTRSHFLAQAISGEVVSCPAWTLNKHKELRIFLKGDTRKGIKAEIEDYANIHVNWIRGKKAIMTILDDDGKTLGEVALYKLKTREDMHKLMKEKGFVKKSRGQKVAERRVELVKQQLNQLESTSYLYSSVSSLYLVIFIVVAGKWMRERDLCNAFVLVLVPSDLPLHSNESSAWQSINRIDLTNHIRKRNWMDPNRIFLSPCIGPLHWQFLKVGGVFVFNGRKRNRIRGTKKGSSNAGLLRV